MANFITIGSRVLNLDLVCAAEREGNAGKVTVYLGAGATPLRMEFTDQLEADQLWIKLSPTGGVLDEAEGGPYSITDNEATASRRPGTGSEVERDMPTTETEAGFGRATDRSRSTRPGT